MRGWFLWKLLKFFNQGVDAESCGDLSWKGCWEKPEHLSDREPDSCAHVFVVLDVTEEPVLLLSVVTELCDVSLRGSDWEFVEPQSFFSKRRAQCGTDTQEEMRYEGSPVKAHPFSRRRMTPPTPLQNSYTSLVRDQGRYEEEGRGEEKQPPRGSNSIWREVSV